MRLQFHRAGHGQDLVFVHGWGFHGGVWREIATALANDFRVTVVDLPGHGRSRDLPAEYTLAALAEQILDSIRRPVIWIGWSLGAMVGLAAARACESAIVSMALIGATPRFVQDVHWPHGLPSDRLEGFALDLERDYRGTLMRFLSLQIGAEANAHAQLRAMRAEMFGVDPPTPQALRAGLRLLQETDLRADIPAVTVPVQMIHGTRDKLVPVGAADYLARHLPHGRLATIAASGHAPFLSHRHVFQQVLEAFVNE